MGLRPPVEYEEEEPLVEHAVASTIRGITNLDIVVVPAELLVGLWSWEEICATEEEANTGD
jgi:hypothetical protein